MTVRIDDRVGDDRSVRDELERTQVDLSRSRAELVQLRDELARTHESVAADQDKLRAAVAEQERLRAEVDELRSTKRRKQTRSRFDDVVNLIKRERWVGWLLVVGFGFGVLATLVIGGVIATPRTEPPSHIGQPPTSGKR